MPIRILHIEDNKEVALHIDDLCVAKDENIVTDWIDNFEEGLDKFRSNPFSYNGIILDAKCFLDQSKDGLDEQFVTRAVYEIEQIFREYRLKVPYCILSGFKERIEGFIEANKIQAYDKDGQEEEAIDYIISGQSDVTRYEFDQEFPDLLPLTEMGFLESNDASTLLQMFKAEKLRSENKSLIKNQIAQARPLLEEIFLKLSELGSYKGEYIIPEEYIKKNGTDSEITHITNCARYLAGMSVRINRAGDETSRDAVMPRHISWQCSAIYNISSPIGNHADSYNGSKNTLSSVFYSLIDVLYWYRGFIIEFQKNN